MAHVSATYIAAEDAPTLRTYIDPPAFGDGDEVVFVAGAMRGMIGKVFASDSRPGTASVYVPAWGCVSHNIEEAHLFRLNS